jgi:hypothetical protein
MVAGGPGPTVQLNSPATKSQNRDKPISTHKEKQNEVVHQRPLDCMCCVNPYICGRAE